MGKGRQETAQQVKCQKADSPVASSRYSEYPEIPHVPGKVKKPPCKNIDVISVAEAGIGPSITRSGEKSRFGISANEARKSSPPVARG